VRKGTNTGESVFGAGVFFFAQNKWVEGQLEVLMD
jgi:hypothetical protein